MIENQNETHPAQAAHPSIDGAMPGEMSESFSSRSGLSRPESVEAPPARRERGFAAMDPQRQRKIASEGGRAAHQKGSAHEFTSEEAARAGAKGGRARAANQAQRMRINQQNQQSRDL